MHKQYFMVEDCPQCGEKDEPNMYKGARISNTNWGHDASCCSDKCGYAYFHNPARIEIKIEIIDLKINCLKLDRARLINQVAEMRKSNDRSKD